MSRLVSLIATSLLVLAAAPATAQTQTWNFRATLDGRDIGSHRFTLREHGAERELATEARFDVKILGLTAYRYRHDATERWRGDCLTSLNARTDDNGERSVVSVTGDALGGCVMTFAYWNPKMLRQTRLLNAQTGRHEAVSVTPLGEESLTVRAREVRATRYRISGSKHPIDLWYSAADEWLALESTVDNGRRLSYRLQ